MEKGISDTDTLELAIDDALSELRVDLLARQDGPDFKLEVVCAYLRSAYARGYHDGLTDPRPWTPTAVLSIFRKLLAKASLAGGRS